jgi:DNA-binding transcriptional regulator YiaG
MVEGERKRPGEALIERWSDEDQDDWGEFRLEDARVVYPSDVDPGDVSAVRRALGMSEGEFATAFGISVITLRRWERGRCAPQGPARALLRVMAREPAAARRALTD